MFDFTLTIRTGNAAFGCDCQEKADEVARILDTVAKRLRDGTYSGRCVDGNGNSVGGFGFAEE